MKFNGGPCKDYLELVEIFIDSTDKIKQFVLGYSNIAVGVTLQNNELFSYVL